MKIDRLYAITVYLLNHGKTSASGLAGKFEVSVRTIQRDIDALCRAGIPIVAETGVSGGYYLSETYHMDRHTATQEDYSFILTALKGFSSAMGNPQIDATLGKVSSLTRNQDDSIILDFSVLREGDEILLKTLRTAIRDKHPVSFTYTNSENVTRIHTVEPIAVIYRWYAWYLLAYSTVKKDYRTYKLIRMSDAVISDLPFTAQHASPEEILRESDRKSPQPSTEVIVRCKSEAKSKAIEYLNGKILRTYENGDCEMLLEVMEKEHFWFGTLLSLGSGVEILAPEHIRVRVLDAAKEIVSLYEGK